MVLKRLLSSPKLYGAPLKGIRVLTYPTYSPRFRVEHYQLSIVSFANSVSRLVQSNGKNMIVPIMRNRGLARLIKEKNMNKEPQTVEELEREAMENWEYKERVALNWPIL